MATSCDRAAGTSWLALGALDLDLATLENVLFNPVHILRL